MSGHGFADSQNLPRDFSKPGGYRITQEFKLSSGGSKSRNFKKPISHYPVIMIPENTRGKSDWLGKNCGNSLGPDNVYNKFIKSGFTPEELWLYQYTQEANQMRNIEELTDGLKWFIYSVLKYTRSSRVQILAHGEGAVLAQATIKKYNLYRLVHALVYIAGPMHGSKTYTYANALEGLPVCANLAPDSDFLMELNFPEETPYNLFKNTDAQGPLIKYLIIHNGLPFADKILMSEAESPVLTEAQNFNLNNLDHDGLRCSNQSSDIFIAFLSDQAIKYDREFDRDKDDFMGFIGGGIDCDDANSSIYPGAVEIADDNIDQDCDGMDLLDVTGKDCLAPVKK